MTIQIIDSKGIKRMQQLASLRPLVSAGAAAVGASLIALTPAVSNDLAADIQHGTVAIQQRAVELTDYVANPIQTWIDVFEAAGINLSSLYTQYQQHPFPIPQQLAANYLQYAVEYVKPYQTAANQGIGYFLGTPNTSTLGIFLPQLGTALADIKAGNITSAFSIFDVLFFNAALYVGEPLETIPQILNPITQNLANATDYLTTTGIQDAGAYFVISLPDEFFGSLGTSLQNVYNSFAAGDPVGALINAIDVPGEVTNAVLNGTPFNGTYGGGLISDGSGLANTLSLLIPQGLAKDMVAPNAQNIMSGGSLPYALGYLGNVVTTGFPTPQTVFDNLLSAIQFAIGNPSGAAAAAADSLATGLPGLSAGVLNAFDPAAFANVAGSLGPSLAAEVAGSLGSSLGTNIAGSLATTLSVELPTLALHILSAL